MDPQQQIRRGSNASEEIQERRGSQIISERTGSPNVSGSRENHIFQGRSSSQTEPERRGSQATLGRKESLNISGREKGLEIQEIRGSQDLKDRRASQESTKRNDSQDSRGGQAFQDTSTDQKNQKKETEESRQKSSSPEDQIKFYGQFAERVISQLKDIKEKVLAARWVLMLERQPVSVIRAEYLKQLLFVCLHGRLAGVFAKSPVEPLSQLPENHTIEWLAKQVSISRQSEQVPVRQELSDAHTEYLAVQNIPYFGTHFFFAVSDDPVENWENPPQETVFQSTFPQ